MLRPLEIKVSVFRLVRYLFWDQLRKILVNLDLSIHLYVGEILI